MDSLSQIVLGAAVGEVMLGSRLGNRAMLLGAIGGTIPDLDILLNPLVQDELQRLRIHRGYSHSMFVHILLALPFAWLSFKWCRDKVTFGRMYLAWYLMFLTHTLLDCCTTYGTQLFLPFTDYLVGFNNISVVDPFWTIPFMLLLVVCMFMRRDNPRRLRWAWIAISWQFVYMGYTLINKYHVDQEFRVTLDYEQILYDELYTTPSIFNNWLWAGIAVSKDSIWFGEYSTLQSSPYVDWASYPRNTDLVKNHPARESVEILEWFSQGKYLARQRGDTLDFFVAKWGRMDFTRTEPEEAFRFYYQVYPDGNGGWKSHPVEPEFGEAEFKEAWTRLWRRALGYDAPQAP
ncbi:MAG: hypothetical protein RL220_1436 [Bacteroidota bacterium]